MNEILVIVALTLVNGFFSGAEISVLSVRRTRLQELTAEGRKAARAALRLRDQPEQFLATVQVGITVVGATAGAFGGATLEEPLAAWLTALGVSRFAEELALAMVVAFISVLTIVLGELVPKSLALRNSERFSLLVAPPVALLARCTKPIVWALTKLSNLVLSPFRDSTTFSESRLSPEELQTLVEEAANAGSLPASVGDIASRAIELGQLAVSAVMIPRNEVVWLELEADHAQVLATLREHPYSRYPVAKGSLDNIEGYVVARDLLSPLVERSMDLRRALLEVPALSERTGALSALRQLQQRRAQFAVIVDEHGMTSGIVTIEDIVEQLVGEILGEHERPDPAIRYQGDGSALVRADTPVQEVNRELGLDLPLSADYATLSGLLMHASSRIMRTGEQIAVDGTRMDVVEATPRQVKLVKIQLPAEAPGGVPTQPKPP